MSTPNPTNPQGSLLEQKAKRKNNLPVIVAIFLGIHAVVIGGILMVGCKPEPKPETKRLPSPEPVLPPITTPPDPVTPVTPAPTTPVPGGAATPPGTLPPIGAAPTTPAPTAPAPVAPLPTTPTPPAVAPAPIVPVTPIAPAPTTPTPVADVAPTGEAKTHVVAKGEYFATIAKKYGVTVKASEAANPGVDSTKLKIGQKLNVPAPAPKAPKTTAGKGPDAAPAPDADGTYTVKSGDVLGSIAKKHGTTVAKLREANGLKTDRITVGQKLKLPSGSAAKKPEATTSAPLAPAPGVVPPVAPALPPLGDPAPVPAPAPKP